MATYKVIQDIEAEDKLLGPLTLRQFIYAGIAAACLYISFLVVTKGAPFLVVLFLPIAFICIFFAFPWRKDQPTEVWALARVRFMFKPHRRIWDQSGIKQLVTITAPKRPEINYTNGLSQTEVKSRLKALAATIDTRGWATKNVNVNLFSQPQPGVQVLMGSDRLLSPAMQQDMAAVDIHAADDILDERSNPVAQNINRLMNASSTSHRQQIMQGLNQQSVGNAPIPAPNNYWFLNQLGQSANLSPGSAMFNAQFVAPGAQDTNTVTRETADERSLAQQLKAQHIEKGLSSSHLRTIHPLSEQNPAFPNPTVGSAINNAKAPVTPTPNPDIVKLAGDNDKSVATLERMVNKRPPESISSSEVVISLH